MVYTTCACSFGHGPIPCHINLDNVYYLQTLEMEGELLAKRVSSSTPSDAEAALVRLQNHLYRSTTKRRFDYNSVIVSLYGFFEQYVESLLREYAGSISAIVPKYELLPEQILKQHIELSYMLLSRIEKTRYKSATTVQEIIANLHSCVSGSAEFKINDDAFSYHSANFRTEVINESFSKLGVFRVSDKVRESEEFQEYLRSIYPDRDVSHINSQEAFALLNDLADRRNDVSHGIDSDILSNPILLDYITFFRGYGAALYEVIRRETLPYIARHQAIELGKAIRVINNNIVCISLHDISLKKGDIIIAKTANDLYFDGEVEEIQVDKVSYDELDPAPDIAVGIKVPFRAKSNQTFMLLPKPLQR